MNIKDRREKLMAEKERAIAQLHAIQGAIAICDEILAEPESNETDKPAEQEQKKPMKVVK